MSKKLFTDEDIKLLSKNKYVKNVTNKGIQWNLNKMTPVKYRNHLIVS